LKGQGTAAPALEALIAAPRPAGLARRIPMAEMYLEDFKPGDQFVSRGVTVTGSMIVEFARAYDPQPFHLDEAAAAQSPYGGLISSGIQTLALGYRTFLDLGLFSACGMGSPGLDELRWLQPVRPGDTIHAEVEIVDVRPSRSKPDRGMLLMAFKVCNQRGEEVLTMLSMQLTRRRPPAASARSEPSLRVDSLPLRVRSNS
jgi:acyl dehydratase